MRRVILTRPTAHMSAWHGAVVEAGFSPIELPLLATEPLPTPLPPEMVWAPRDILYFVSRTAIDNFARHFVVSTWCECWCIAPGPGTAAQLRDLGVADACIIAPPVDAQLFDVEHAWPVLAQRITLGPQWRLWVVQGEDAMNTQTDTTLVRSSLWLTAQAQHYGIPTTPLVLYRRTLPDWSVSQAETAQAATQDGSIWLLTSSQGIRNLRQLLPEARWDAALALVTHPRIAQSAAQLGFGRIITTTPNINEWVRALHAF